MRVLIAPDCFGGTLTAREAADAIATGWREAKPDDVVTQRPLADGGPGFVDVLHAALNGDIRYITVTGPLGEPVEARWLSVHTASLDGDSPDSASPVVDSPNAGGRRVAYIESAEACGLHLIPAELRPQSCETATTRGVGELIRAAAVDNDVIYIGLGGSGTTDGGAGMLAALSGASAHDDAVVDTDTDDGVVDLTGTSLVVASDVENPLLGPHGAARTFGPQKGASPEAVERLEAKLAAMDVLKPVADISGAGAAGGLGAALLSLGATVTSGAGLVRELTGLDAALDDADVVVTGEGSFDWQSLRGKLITAVASGAAERGIPCVAVAGQVSVGRREMGAAGVQEAYSVSEHVGSVQKAMAEARASLVETARHVANQWSR
ncbi:glycerate kinase [Lentzea sp. NPDC058436]|uniref:glycerate kinase family protein n=1 Tax=Lentzea sp. NPDC058436 TaxID=3346499 RepID=UPI00364A7286